MRTRAFPFPGCLGPGKPAVLSHLPFQDPRHNHRPWRITGATGFLFRAKGLIYAMQKAPRGRDIPFWYIATFIPRRCTDNQLFLTGDNPVV